MNRLSKILIVALSVLIFSYAGLGYVLGKSGDEKTYRSLNVYSEVLQRIQQDYVDEPDMHLVTSGALHGLLEALDPLSGYLTPREYTEYRQKLAAAKKGETGVTLSKRYGYIIVISVLQESPAAKAGVHSGDILEAIAGFTTRDMAVGQALNLLAGDPGTSVKVAIVRRGRAEPTDMDLVRAQIGPQHIVTQKVDPDIMVLRLPTFETGRAEELRARLQELDKQGIHKVVLDVRDCGRGEMSEGIAVARLFLTSGNVATLRGQTVSAQVIPADPAKVAWKGAVSVLIGPTTSGAAELLAVGIGSNHRGDIVGERTYGLASEQRVIPLEDGAAVILTVANYFPATGKSILEEGVSPTVAVREAAADQSDAVDDDASGVAPSAPSLESRPLSPEDPVLRKAIELLKGPARKAA